MYKIITKPYLYCDEYRKISLDNLYENNSRSIEDLKYNLEAIITTESPITLTVLKERLRQAFEVSKISQKALDIILYYLKDMAFPTTKDLDDIVIWSLDGIYKPTFLRYPSKRNIYEIPNCELKYAFEIIKGESGLQGYELYKEVLNYFGYEVLTNKALLRLNYIEKYNF